MPKAPDLAAFLASPQPTEDTIEACAAALKAEGFPGMSIGGVHMSVDEIEAKELVPFVEEWVSLLHEWRFLQAMPKED